MIITSPVSSVELLAVVESPDQNPGLHEVLHRLEHVVFGVTRGTVELVFPFSEPEVPDKTDRQENSGCKGHSPVDEKDGEETGHGHHDVLDHVWHRAHQGVLDPIHVTGEAAQEIDSLHISEECRMESPKLLHHATAQVGHRFRAQCGHVFELDMGSDGADHEQYGHFDHADCQKAVALFRNNVVDDLLENQRIEDIKNDLADDPQDGHRELAPIDADHLHISREENVGFSQLFQNWHDLKE